MIASKPATQSRAVCTLASDTLAEPGRIQFSERFAIWDVPSMLKYQALENYLLQISRSGLFVTRIFAFKIRNVGVIYRSSSSETFVALLTTVAQAISTSVRGSEFFVAYAGEGQHQDAGAKMVHCAPETSSTIVSKSIYKDGGITTYRGLVQVDEGATGSKSYVRCDALLLDEKSISETKPYMEVSERDAAIGHEATVSKVGDDQLFYLMSRGLSESQAMGMIVNGFIEPITRTLPMEYAVEWSRLIELQMEGSIG